MNIKKLALTVMIFLPACISGPSGKALPLESQGQMTPVLRGHELISRLVLMAKS